jgi:chromosomal replication initiator protein
MLGSKEGTQSAFFSTFEALVPHGKQIVLTSDTYAKQLKDVDERLKSRFAGGMSVPLATTCFI